MASVAYFDEASGCLQRLHNTQEARQPLLIPPTSGDALAMTPDVLTCKEHAFRSSDPDVNSDNNIPAPVLLVLRKKSGGELIQKCSSVLARALRALTRQIDRGRSAIDVLNGLIPLPSLALGEVKDISVRAKRQTLLRARDFEASPRELLRQIGALLSQPVREFAPHKFRRPVNAYRWYGT